MILLMSVNPGFSGQLFIPGTLDKLGRARQLIDDSGLDIRLEIDGGVKLDNIRSISEAGAAIFSAADESDPNRYDSIIRAMRTEIDHAA